jgi:hypothetical protein
LGVLAGAVLLLNLAAKYALLPVPPIGWDAESGVLLHQSLACRKASEARVLIVGDSTCLVGVDALELSRLLPDHNPALSLALFIWLDLGVYGEEVADFVAAHPGQVSAVVLLVSPSKLSGMGQDPTAQKFWREVHHAEGADAANGAKPTRPDWLGGRILRRDVLSHVLETPLRGSGASLFGFASETEAYMSKHRGSLVSPGTAPPVRFGKDQTRVSWVLAPALEAESRVFRAEMPAGVNLYLGLTPVPGDPGSESARSGQAELLREWNRWIGADALLTNLPPTLPSVMFAGGGHLNEVGQKRLTAALGRELARLMTGVEPPAQ